MKILAYNSTYMGAGHQAGGETTLHDMMLALKQAGHKVMALASRPFKDGSGSYVLDGVPVQAFSSKQDPDLYFPRFDLVLTQFECAQRAWYLGMKHSIPTVQAVHNNTEYSTGIAIKYNDSLVYNSWHVKNSIEDELFKLDKDKKRSCLFHPLIDPAVYRVDTTREYITLVNLSDGEPPFYNKGYEHFYDLAEHFPNEKFLGVKGAYGTQVVRDLPNVTIVEHTNDIREIYKRSKIVLMPSEIESYGRVAIEAAASGIPALTSEAPGLLESNIGYKKIPFRKFELWRGALQKLLSDYEYASLRAQEMCASLYNSGLHERQDFVRFIEETKEVSG